MPSSREVPENLGALREDVVNSGSGDETNSEEKKITNKDEGHENWPWDMLMMEEYESDFLYSCHAMM